MTTTTTTTTTVEKLLCNFLPGGVSYKAVSEEWLDQFQHWDTFNEGTNSLVMSKLGLEGWFVVHCHTMSHKTHKTWYLGMVTPIFSIIGILILYSKNILCRSSIGLWQLI